MMERKASEGIAVYMGGGSCPDNFFYDEDRLKGKAALKRMGYVDYVKEFDRRISKSVIERTSGKKLREQVEIE